MSIHVRDTLRARTRKGQISSHLEPPCALHNPLLRALLSMGRQQKPSSAMRPRSLSIIFLGDMKRCTFFSDAPYANVSPSSRWERQKRFESKRAIFISSAGALVQRSKSNGRMATVERNWAPNSITLSSRSLARALPGKSDDERETFPTTRTGNKKRRARREKSSHQAFKRRERPGDDDDDEKKDGPSRNLSRQQEMMLRGKSIQKAITRAFCIFFDAPASR